MNNITSMEIGPVAYEFLNNHNELSVIMGPIASGKTTVSMIKIFKYAMCIRKCKDGVRRSKFVVVRNTRKELKDTTIKSWLDLFSNFGSYDKEKMIFNIKILDIESEIIFIALDNEKSYRKLLATECTGIYFNNLKEIDRNIYSMSIERTGRYPSLVAHGTKSLFDLEKAKEIGIELDYSGFYDEDGNIKPIEKQPKINLRFVIADTTPPVVNSYYYKLFEGLLYNEETNKYENPKNFKLYKQPSGLSPNAENIEYLPKNYYQNIVKILPKKITDVIIGVNYG